MFNSLISESIRQNEIKQIVLLKKSLLDTNEKDVVDWCLEYYEAHGSLPTEERFKRERNFSIYWTDFDKGVPLNDLLSETGDTLRYNKFQKLSSDLSEKYHTDGKFDFYSAVKVVDELTPLVDNPATSILDFNGALFDDRETNCLPFGIPKIDYITKGIDVGDFVQLFAPVGVGKTTFLTFYALRAAMSKQKVLFFTTEVTKKKIEEKIAAIVGGFNSSAFKRATDDDKNIIKTNKTKVRNGLEAIKIGGGEIKIPESTVFTPEIVREMVKNEIRDTGSGYDLVIFDSFYNISIDGINNVADDWKSFFTASFKMLMIAKTEEFNTRVLISSQIKPEKKDDIVFTFQDINYCKAIVQHADVVLSLANHKVRNFGLQENEKGWLCNVMKIREGPTDGINAAELLVNFGASELFTGDTKFTSNISHKELEF